MSVCRDCSLRKNHNVTYRALDAITDAILSAGCATTVNGLVSVTRSHLNSYRASGTVNALLAGGSLLIRLVAESSRIDVATSVAVLINGTGRTVIVIIHMSERTVEHRLANRAIGRLGAGRPNVRVTCRKVINEATAYADFINVTGRTFHIRSMSCRIRGDIEISRFTYGTEVFDSAIAVAGSLDKGLCIGVSLSALNSTSAFYAILGINAGCLRDVRHVSNCGDRFLCRLENV